jgi:hypothetical protein
LFHNFPSGDEPKEKIADEQRDEVKEAIDEQKDEVADGHGLVAETIREKGVDERVGVVEAAVGEGETVYP